MGAPVTDVVTTSATLPEAMTPGQRAGRAVLASGVATSVALVSHLVGGGSMPGVLGVAVPLLLATSVCLVLAPVRLTWVRLSVSVTVSQLLFHTLFSLGAVGSTTGPATVSTHEHAGAVMLGAETAVVAHVGHASGGMWLAHVGAGVVTILALRHGEATLARVTAALRRAAHRILVVHVPVPPVLPKAPAAPLRDERDWRPVARVLTADSVVRRGPPAMVVPLFS